MTEKDKTKRCPYCGEEILAVAKKCKHCGEWLEEKNGVQSSTMSNAKSEIAQSQTDKSQIEEEQPQTVETDHRSEVQTSKLPSQSSPQTNAATAIVEPDNLSKERTKRKLYGIVIPTIATIVFAVALMVIHANYRYIYWWVDEGNIDNYWWIDEENIVIPAIIAFVVLFAIYFFILYKKEVFKNKIGIAVATILVLIIFGLFANFNKKEFVKYEDIKARVLYGEDYENVVGGIIETEEQLKNAKDPVTKKKLQYQLSELKAKRDAYQVNEVSNQKGWSMGSMGKISQVNKKTKDYRVKLAEAQNRKEHFHEYFNSVAAGKNLDPGQLADLYDELWDQVCKDVDQAEKDMQDFEGKSKAEGDEIKEKNAKHERFIKTSKADLDKEIAMLGKNGKDYFDGVKDLFEKYGEDVLMLIGLSARDLDKNYLRTQDPMYENGTWLQKMQDIDIDERMGKFTHEEAKKAKSGGSGER